MHLIRTDSSGLKTYWDEENQRYAFEGTAGAVLDATVTPHSGNPAAGFTGPTIEALIACAQHRLQSYQDTHACEENRRALFALELAQFSLAERAERAERVASELAQKKE